jgi:rhodanese-related sulfurtransferase
MTSIDRPQLQNINAPTLKQLINSLPKTLRERQGQQLLLLDVRETGEYASEHIPDALLCPLSTLDPSSIEFQVERKILLYCQSGRRSIQAAQKLLESGFTDVTHLEGGLNAWKAAGYATQTDLNAPISLFRQVQIVAGSLVVLGTVLGTFGSPWFLLLCCFVGCGLVFAGISDTCAMGMLLMKLPYNRRVKSS